MVKLDSTNIKPWEVDFDLNGQGLLEQVDINLEMNPEIANSLNPATPSVESLKWADIFKNVTISGDEGYHNELYY